MPSLLPPASTPLERALEAATARVGDVDIAAIGTLWDPARCPLPLLPWLAWSLSVDQWDAAWPEAMKREMVAQSIELHRRKGTRESVEAVLARFDALLRVVEWHQASPRAAPHTFQVILPLVTEPGVAPGGARSTAAFAEAIIREVVKVKPLREHLELVQQVHLAGQVGLSAVARLVLYRRLETAFTVDPSPLWDRCLQTEDGEPIELAEGAGFLEDA